MSVGPRGTGGGPVGQAGWADSALPDQNQLQQHVAGATSLSEQLLAAQLQALQLGGTQLASAAAPAAYPGMPAALVPIGAPPGSGRASPSPHQLDASLLAGGGDLLAQLQMGAAGPLLGAGLVAMPGAGGVAALPPHLAPGAAAAAAAQQQQQQQQQRQVPQGRRRSQGVRRNEEKVRRTVYISDISDAVSEAELAGFFAGCGQLVDCRVCGDPNSSMRFAFIEFVSEEAAQQALSKSGALLGDFPIRVSPSKTAIVPVNNTYLPRSSEERELVARTVFVGNVDRVVEREQLRDFFENLCGQVSKIRVLGDTQHSAKIAFIEFATADSARAALKLSGALLGTLPLRVSPSKTPVRADGRRGREGSPALQLPPLPAVHAQHSAQHLNPALLMAVAGLTLPAYGSQPGNPYT